MKLTKQKLINLIKEEMQNTILNEGAPPKEKTDELSRMVDKHQKQIMNWHHEARFEESDHPELWDYFSRFVQAQTDLMEYIDYDYNGDQKE
tara:strand:+ start:388 stop:660 length:273 start_codon:yes stop_codon:yes gene_type:complete